MSSRLPVWAVVIAAALTMLQLGVRTNRLTLPELVVRCGACRRLVRRGRTCPCTRPTRP